MLPYGWKRTNSLTTTWCEAPAQLLFFSARSELWHGLQDLYRAYAIILVRACTHGRGLPTKFLPSRLIQLHFPHISPILNGGMCSEAEMLLVVGIHFVSPWYDPSRLTGRKKTSSIYLSVYIYLSTDVCSSCVGQVSSAKMYICIKQTIQKKPTTLYSFTVSTEDRTVQSWLSPYHYFPLRGNRLEHGLCQSAAGCSVLSPSTQSWPANRFDVDPWQDDSNRVFALW